MVHPDVVPKPIMSMDAKSVDFKVDVGKQFTNEHEFFVCDHMFQWICMESAKLGFGVVIESSSNGLDKRHAFVKLRCEISDKYINPIQKLKRDDTG